MFYSLGVEDCFESIYRAAKSRLQTGKDGYAPLPTKAQRLKRPLAYLEIIDPTLFDIFNLVVKEVWVTQESNRPPVLVPGKLILTDRAGMTIWNHWDALVEGLSHQLLLLDELQTPHFDPRENCDMDPEIQELRELVFQVVGSCESLCFRRRALRIFDLSEGAGHFTERLKLCEQALSALYQALEGAPVTERLQQIVQAVEESLAQMKGALKPFLPSSSTIRDHALNAECP